MCPALSVPPAVGGQRDPSCRAVEFIMLRWALIFLIVAIVAAAMGFGGISGMSADIARILFFVFLVLLVVSVIMHLATGKKGSIL
jgi:uncharacterized membrane protein YtjA (UPF0391 family)